MRTESALDALYSCVSEIGRDTHSILSGVDPVQILRQGPFNTYQRVSDFDPRSADVFIPSAITAYNDTCWIHRVDRVVDGDTL